MVENQRNLFRYLCLDNAFSIIKIVTSLIHPWNEGNNPLVLIVGTNQMTGTLFLYQLPNRSRDYRNGLGWGMVGPVGPDIRMNRIFWLPKIFSVLIERFKLIFGPVDSECQIRLNRFPIPFESLTGSFDWSWKVRAELGKTFQLLDDFQLQWPKYRPCYLRQNRIFMIKLIFSI